MEKPTERKTADAILKEVYSEGQSENIKYFLKLFDYSESKEVKAMEEYAKQEADIKVKEFKEEMLKMVLRIENHEWLDNDARTDIVRHLGGENHLPH